jgi:hypothetical protein
MRLLERFRKRKVKNPFEGSIVVDNPDIKVVEAKYEKIPFLLAVGTSTQRELSVSGQGSMEKVGAKYQSQKELDWRLFYNPKALPDFIPLEEAKQLMAGTVATSSGSISVLSTQTTFEAVDPTYWEMKKKKNEEKIRCGFCNREVSLEATFDIDGNIICEDCLRIRRSKT